MAEQFGRLYICVAVLLFGHHQAGGAKGGGQGHILKKEQFFFRETLLREAITQKKNLFGKKHPNDLTPSFFLIL